VKKIWEWFAWRIAWRLPNRLAYYAAVRVHCHGTVGKYGQTIMSELTGMDALDRFSTDKKLYEIPKDAGRDPQLAQG
jgi:hypothetical protein